MLIKVKRAIGLLTEKQRMLPTFLIIGAGKNGTTSLYDYMVQHKKISSAIWKEVHYFDYNWLKGLGWYRSHFPLKSGDKITGESSPAYFSNPLAQERAAKTLPDAKLIVILSNPIDRSYSGYQHEVRNGNEKLSWEEAIKKEPAMVESELKKVIKDPSYYDIKFNAFTHLYRSYYFQHLSNWMKFFRRDQFKIITQENLTNRPAETLDELFEFVGVIPQNVNTMYRLNIGKYPPMKQETREKLVEHFRPHNEKLYKLLGKNYDWDH